MTVDAEFKPAPIKPTISFADLDRFDIRVGLFDIGYADGVKPALAVPESKVPNGTRAG